MSLIEYLQNISELKLSLGKNSKYFEQFSNDIEAKHMNLPQFGLNLDKNLLGANQLRAAFQIIQNEKGYFIFNINGVDLEKAKAGFSDFETAYDNNMITEWELFYILENTDYLERTIFHNGKVQFTHSNLDIKYLWN